MNSKPVELSYGNTTGLERSILDLDDFVLELFKFIVVSVQMLLNPKYNSFFLVAVFYLDSNCFGDF